jgi:S-adenosyl-L-methionine hydrolase (adenosine-forming)
MKIVTFLTDFGNNSGYIAQMKGVILKQHPSVCFIDVSHGISPHSIQTGAFILQSTVPYFPKGTIHIGVIDPGVGTDRRGLVIVTNDSIFIGPDNGLLIPAAQKQGSFIAYEITKSSYLSKPVSHTFHGRDIFAQIAAHILTGISFDSIGPQVHDYKTIETKKPTVKDNSIIGHVLYIDDFGNIITTIDDAIIQKHLSLGKMYTLIINKKEYMIPYHKSYGFIPLNQLLLTVGSANLIEIAVNQGNAAETLKVNIDDAIEIKLS